jgi:hypothetical protein
MRDLFNNSKSKLVVMAAGIILAAVLLSGAGDLWAYFGDPDGSTGNQVGAWNSRSWIQTSQADFEAGVLSDVDTSSSPGDVTMAAAAGSVTDEFTDESKIASKTNLTVTGGQVKLSALGPFTLRPNGAGDKAELSRYPGTGEANWQDVDEVTSDGDSTYVYAPDGTWKRDIHAFEDVSGAGTINGVTIYAKVRALSAPTGTNIRLQIRSGGMTKEATETTSTSSYADYSYTWATNPVTGFAWSWAEINLLEAGVKLRQQGSETRATQAWVLVDRTGYETTGTMTSVNMRAGTVATTLGSFDYTASSIPAGTGLQVQFSQDGSTWYNSSGTSGGWDTLSQGTGSVSLAGLGWSGPGFYYRTQFTSDAGATPLLDQVTVTYGVVDPFTDESKIASKTNLVVTGGQVKLSTLGPFTLRPNGAGDKSELSRYPNTGEANWQDVDEETTDEDSTYVYRDAGWARDLYTLTDVSTTGTINSVTVWSRARTLGTATGTDVRLQIRTGGSTYEGTELTATTSYADYSHAWATNPKTGAAWTWTDINALEAGVKLQKAGYQTRSTQVWVVVDRTTYASSGTFTSTNLLSGADAPFVNSFTYTAPSIASGTSLQVQFSQNGSTWYNSSGTLGGWDTLSQGTSTLSLSGLGWVGPAFYYQAQLTSDGNSTPLLDQVTVNYVPSYGTIASAVFDTGASGSKWDSLAWDRTLAGGTNITFEVRASDTSFAKDASSPSWTSVGGTSPVASGLPSGRYVQWRGRLSTTVMGNSPSLHAVRVYYP